MHDLFPSIKGKCACACGVKLHGRKRKWSSNECRDNSLVRFQVIKGEGKVIRQLLFEQEQGFCRKCGVYDENWEADHIIPVHKGGGACELVNFQTLCPSCHKEKSWP